MTKGAMNLAKLKQSIGTCVRLRPPAICQAPDGRALQADDEWLVESASHDGLRLYNVRTDHVLELNPDHVHHFTSGQRSIGAPPTGFLELNVQVTLSGLRCSIEPILSGAARVSRFSVSTRAPLPNEGREGDVWFVVDE